MDPELRCAFVASGEAHAQQVRGFLEAAGIQTAERGEALRNSFGLTLNGIGAVEILVTEADLDKARALLADAEAGSFRLGDGDETVA
jgi:hypothetical protein